MTVKNTLLGGTDFTGEKCNSADMNDTFNALVNFGITCSNAVPPVGSIMAFHKDWLSTRSIPDGWVSCNGQTLSDVNSLLHNTVIPNMNGTTDSNKLFVKGSSTSGTTGGASTHTHSYGTSRVYHQSGCSRAAHDLGDVPSASSIPPYFEIHWIIRVR